MISINKKRKLRYTLITLVLFSACASPEKNASVPIANSKIESKQPFLTSPKVRKIWVPEKIENDKFIEGHYMWILEKTSSWSQ